jgi:hypothetical protein
MLFSSILPWGPRAYQSIRRFALNCKRAHSPRYVDGALPLNDRARRGSLPLTKGDRRSNERGAAGDIRS